MYSDEQLFNYWDKRISALSEDSQAIYRRALSSFDSFLNSNLLNLSDISENLVLDWAADLLWSGLAYHTMLQFIDVLSSLVNSAIKEGVMNDTRAVKEAKELVRTKQNNHDSSVGLNVLPKLFSLLRMSGASLGDDAIYRDILLLSLLNGAMPLMELAKLKRNELQGFDDSSMFIFRRYIDKSRRKYLFNLGQSRLTPNQLKRHVYSNILLLLNRYVDSTIKNVDDALYSFWTLLAIKCGARCSVALGCVASHTELYQPAFVSPVDVASSVRQSLLQSIGSIIINDPPRWYAMRLRRRVSYDDIKKTIQSSSPTLPDIELFYPSEAIASRVGKKMVYRNQPIIRDIVFFKSRAMDIAPIFHAIGDKAWCYRVSNNPGAPYAVIPKEDFENFQTAIGHFTEDTQIMPLESAIPNPDEEVVLIGSIWSGRKAKFNKSVTGKNGKILYRVVLSPDSGFAFRVDVDPRNVKFA